MATETVKDLLNDAVTYDGRYLAHAIFYCVQNKKVRLEDSTDKLRFSELSQAEHLEIIQMRESNVLAMCEIKLFTVPMADKLFAFYLAENVVEAAGEHRRNFNQEPAKIINITDSMDKSLMDTKTNKSESFRELKRRTIDFPIFAGLIRKGE